MVSRPGLWEMSVLAVIRAQLALVVVGLTTFLILGAAQALFEHPAIAQQNGYHRRLRQARLVIAGLGQERPRLRRPHHQKTPRLGIGGAGRQTRRFQTGLNILAGDRLVEKLPAGTTIADRLRGQESEKSTGRP